MPQLNTDGLTPEALAERERCCEILAKAASNNTGCDSLRGAWAAIQRGRAPETFDPKNPMKPKR